MGWLKKLLRPRSGEIIVVSGLPRSGTSMMMRMLEAGHIPLLVDNIRAANEDNPRGYYEYERVKKLPEGDTDWLKQAQGRAVKIIAALLPHLPDTHHYRVLFMRRRMEEILASQRVMLIRRGEEPDRIDDREMAKLYENHLAQVYQWMSRQSFLTYMDVDYNAILANPEPEVRRIARFLGHGVDRAAMLAAIDPALYRQHGQD